MDGKNFRAEQVLIWSDRYNSKLSNVALMHYSKKYTFDIVLTDNWFDIGHEDRYYNSLIEVKARESNHISIDRIRGILKRTSAYVEKFTGEIKWYLKLPADVEYVKSRIFGFFVIY